MSLMKRWSFNRLSLNARVVLVVAVVIAGLTGLTVMNAFESRTRQMEGLERTLRSEIQSAISVATAYDKRAAAGEFSAAEAKRLALRQIEDMQWDGGKGYIFAFDSGMTMPASSALMVAGTRCSTVFHGRNMASENPPHRCPGKSADV